MTLFEPDIYVTPIGCICQSLSYLFFCRLIATPSCEFHQFSSIFEKKLNVIFFSVALGGAKSLSPLFLSVASPLQFFAATAALAFFVPMHEPHISPISCLYLVSCRGSQRVTDEKHIETL